MKNRGLKSQNQTLFSTVLKKLKSAIIDGEFQIGDILLPERELAAFYGVSHSTIRKITQALVDEGVLVKKQGLGVIVTKLPAIEKKIKRIACLMNAVSWESTYLLAITNSISQVLAKDEIEMIFVSSDGNEIPRTILNGDILGVIILGSSVRTQVLRLNNAGIPNIAIGNHSFGTNVKSVLVDEYASGFTAVEYLFKKGHKKITFYGGIKDSPSHTLRKFGYKKAMQEFKLYEYYSHVPSILGKNDDGTEILKKIQSSEVTAIVTSSRSYADKLAKILNEKSILFPDHISIVTLGNYAINLLPTETLIYDSIGTSFSDLCSLAIPKLQTIIEGKWHTNQSSIFAKTVLKQAGSVRNI